MGSPDVPGTLFAEKYRLERPLARGATAVVWEATHVLTGRTVALKLCDPQRGFGAKQRARWLREARAASRVSHPSLLPILDIVELDEERTALVMERLLGEPLRARIEAGPLPVDEVRRLFAPVVEALRQAHEAGIVHRDLKPDNLFVTSPEGRLVVLDFGVAKVTSEDELGLTSTGATVGTPYYMAPEQLFGEDDVDARADVWSLGVVLHECLTGRRPVEASNLGQLLKKINAGAVARLTEADLPERPDLAALVAQMLSVDREARPSLAQAHAALTSAGPVEAPANRASAPEVQAAAPAVHAVSSTSLPPAAPSLPPPPAGSPAPPRRLARRAGLGLLTAACALLGAWSLSAREPRASLASAPPLAPAPSALPASPAASPEPAAPAPPAPNAGGGPAASAQPPPSQATASAAARPRDTAAAKATAARPDAPAAAPSAPPAPSPRAEPLAPRIVENPPF